MITLYNVFYIYLSTDDVSTLLMTLVSADHKFDVPELPLQQRNAVPLWVSVCLLSS